LFKGQGVFGGVAETILQGRIQGMVQSGASHALVDNNAVIDDAQQLGADSREAEEKRREAKEEKKRQKEDKQLNGQNLSESDGSDAESEGKGDEPAPKKQKVFNFERSMNTYHNKMKDKLIETQTELESCLKDGNARLAMLSKLGVTERSYANGEESLLRTKLSCCEAVLSGEEPLTAFKLRFSSGNDPSNAASDTASQTTAGGSGEKASARESHRLGSAPPIPNEQGICTMAEVKLVPDLI
jgi:hypothetical protein